MYMADENVTETCMHTYEGSSTEKAKGDDKADGGEDGGEILHTHHVHNDDVQEAHAASDANSECRCRHHHTLHRGHQSEGWKKRQARENTAKETTNTSAKRYLKGGE